MRTDTTIYSRREEIVSVFMNRITNVFTESSIHRGFFDESVSTYDRFYIFDLPESCVLEDRRRGMYVCTFPISISYWVQLDPTDLFTVGNYLMEKIRLAIELDERLNGLVLSYRLEEGALLWYDEGVLDVEMMFVVEYTKDAGWVSNPFKP